MEIRNIIDKLDRATTSAINIAHMTRLENIVISALIAARAGDHDRACALVDRAIEYRSENAGSFPPATATQIAELAMIVQQYRQRKAA